MKPLKSIILNSLLLLSFICQAQKEGNIWHFGHGAGLDFNSGSPVNVSYSAINTMEGCASISDANGSLLFYTDGVNVWNKDHNTMNNGIGLLGNFSSTQSAIIVPKPGSNNIYYIFTVGCGVGLSYSEVDMNLSGDLGDVTTKKNIPLINPTLEKLTAVLHNNGSDIWVITHGWNNNTFYSYLVTKNGVNISPIISNSGTIISGWYYNKIGYMKASPSGKHLALAHWANQSELFDFDNTNGIVSNSIGLNTFSNGMGAYGIEFSPSGNKLYLAESINPYNGTSFSDEKILQYDLKATDIPMSEKVIATIPEEIYAIGALQLGPDGKIYIANMGLPTIGVINDPEEMGIDCNIAIDEITLNGYCKGGLPNMIQSYFYIPDEEDEVPSNNVAYLPSAFSPNSDGINDQLYIRGAGIDECVLSIYNRFGELVFQTTDQNEGWNGTYNGEALNSEVYITHASIVFEDGEEKELFGNVTLAP